MTKPREPEISIYGQPVTYAQAMAIRVAVTDFYGQTGDPDMLGDDELGRAMTAAYRDRLKEVLDAFAGK